MPEETSRHRAIAPPNGSHPTEKTPRTSPLEPRQFILPLAHSSPRIRMTLQAMACAIGALALQRGRAENRTPPPTHTHNALALIRKEQKLREVGNFAHVTNFQLLLSPASP